MDTLRKLFSDSPAHADSTILLLGSPGPGKSAFIKLACNGVVNEQGDQHQVTPASAGEIKTFKIQLSDGTFATVIDAPCITAHSSVDAREQFMAGIVSHLQRYSHVHCIVLFQSDDTSHLESSLDYAVAELAAILPIAASENVFAIKPVGAAAGERSAPLCRLRDGVPKPRMLILPGGEAEARAALTRELQAVSPIDTCHIVTTARQRQAIEKLVVEAETSLAFQAEAQARHDSIELTLNDIAGAWVSAESCSYHMVCDESHCSQAVPASTVWLIRCIKIGGMVWVSRTSLLVCFVTAVTSVGVFVLTRATVLAIIFALLSFVAFSCGTGSCTDSHACDQCKLSWQDHYLSARRWEFRFNRVGARASDEEAPDNLDEATEDKLHLELSISQEDIAASRCKYEEATRKFQGARLRLGKAMDEYRQMALVGSYEAMMRQQLHEVAEISLHQAELKQTATLLHHQEHLQRRLRMAEMSADWLCPICMVSERGVAFGCGHSTCSSCHTNIQICPQCRQPVALRLEFSGDKSKSPIPSEHCDPPCVLIGMGSV